MTWFSKFIGRTAEWLAPLAALGVFVYIVQLGYANGGRWDLYEQLAMADRWPHSYGYTVGEKDGYIPSSVYFPGMSMLMIAFRALHLDSEPFVYVVAAWFGIGVIAVTFKFYRDLGGALSFFKYLGVGAAIGCLFLTTWIGYASEMKPDSAALIAFLAGFWLLSRNRKTLVTTVIGLAFFISAILLKQQITALVAVLAVSGLVCFRYRGWLHRGLVSLTAIGVAFLIVFATPGALNFALLAHIGRGMVLAIDLGHYRILVGVALLAWTLVVLMRRGAPSLRANFVMSHENTLYLVVALVWLIVGVAGNLNIGGNSGNLASGILLLLPLIVIVFERSMTWLPNILILTAVALLGIQLSSAHLGDLAESRIEQGNFVRDRIASLPAGSRILISGQSYLSVRGLRNVRLSEIDAWGHLSLGAMKGLAARDVRNLLAKVSPAAVICEEGCSAFADLVPAMQSAGYKPVRDASGDGEPILYEGQPRTRD